MARRRGRQGEREGTEKGKTQGRGGKEKGMARRMGRHGEGDTFFRGVAAPRARLHQRGLQGTAEPCFFCHERMWDGDGLADWWLPTSSNALLGRDGGPHRAISTSLS